MYRMSRSLIHTIIAAALLLPLPAAGALEGELRLQNDALAWTTAGEWDDFRTAGGSLLLREDALAFRLGYYSLTRRSPDGIEPSLRSDELLLSGARRYSLYAPGEETGIFFTPGVSLRLLGDLGSRAAQQLVHSQTKTERPIPESYSPAAWEAGADLRLAARFRLIPERELWWHAEANTELRSSGSASLSAEAGTGLERSDFFLKAAAAWQFEFGEVATPALQAVRNQSAGPQVKLLYGTPPLLFSRTAYLASGWGEGRIELSLPLNRRRESVSATAPPLRNLTEIGMPLDARALEQRSLLYPVHLPLSARLRFLAGIGIGWNIDFITVHEGLGIERSNALRLPLVTALQWRAGRFEAAPFLLLAPAAELFRLFEESGDRAQLIDERVIPAVRAAAGLRLGFFTGAYRSTGLSLEAWYSLRMGPTDLASYRLPPSDAGIRLALYVARR